MRKLIKPGRITALVVMLVALLGIYVYFLYQVQIVEGTERYNSATAITKDTRTVTAARGNILDRYGRVLVSNKECYNLVIDSTKLFANDDPNAVILELIEMVRGFGDTYTDDLPITTEPPFEYTDMTEIQRTMLDAYFADKASDFKDAGLPESPSAVELMSYMRTRYGISNEYSAEEMRMIAGLRYSINVRYAVNTGEYVFVQDASMKLISSILENKLNGIEVKRSFTRQYHTENAAHILGYVGLMTQEEYEKYSLLDYANDAMVGKDGVENAFEEYLHGKDGEVEETRNASGTILSTVYTKEPEPGNNVYLTIDINLQEAVERVLDAGVNALIRTRENEKMEQTAKGLWTFEDGKYEITGAAAVVVNVKTGEPLAIASWPTYDVTTIIENYADLMKAENTPLFNRALMGAYAPGSTFKPCTAVAALESGVITPSTTILDRGIYDYYSSPQPRCWIYSSYGSTHGRVDVSEAITVSCNYFFYEVGRLTGIKTLDDYATQFGLGQYTGIEIGGPNSAEAKGALASPEYAEANDLEWSDGQTLTAAIGQSYNLFTPLQLANYIATLVGNGEHYAAHLLKNVKTYNNSAVVYAYNKDPVNVVEMQDSTVEAIKTGMHDLTTGSLSTYFSKCVVSAGAKTGTAETGVTNANNGTFVCFAPYDDPQIAVAVVIEKGGAGAALAETAVDILNAYFSREEIGTAIIGENTLLN